MPQRFPRAADLATLFHCSACGETDPVTEDGYTECCNRRACHGTGPDAQDACCAAVQERLEYEADHGAPPAPARRTAPAPARRKPARRSTRIDETRDLQDANGPANLVSHPGGDAPTPADTEEPDMARSPYSRATSAVIRKLMADGPNSFEPVGYRFSNDRATFQEMAQSYLKDATALATKTIEGADWDEVYAAFRDETPAAPADRPATGWTVRHGADEYHGYAVMAADKGRAWHLSRHNDEAVCGARVDRYIGLERAAGLKGICTSCSRYLDKHGAYTPAAAPQAPATEPAPAAPAAAPAAPRKTARQAQGDASAPGWELLYDKPKQGCEVGRRYVDGKPEYALICKAHGHVHPLPRLTAERSVRANGGWCPAC